MDKKGQLGEESAGCLDSQTGDGRQLLRLLLEYMASFPSGHYCLHGTGSSMLSALQDMHLAAGISLHSFCSDIGSVSHDIAAH